MTGWELSAAFQISEVPESTGLLQMVQSEQSHSWKQGRTLCSLANLSKAGPEERSSPLEALQDHRLAKVTNVN
jgi:hypothetical protein